PALRVHPVRRRTPQLHRCKRRDGRAQARHRYVGAAVCPRPRTGSTRRGCRRNDDVSALRNEDADTEHERSDTMSQQTASKSPHTRDYYNRAAHAVPEFTVLNYGFSSEPENSVIARDEPEFYCLRLYEHSVAGTPLDGRDVLEVSSGRGGGARFLSRTYRPRRVVGIDLS